MRFDFYNLLTIPVLLLIITLLVAAHEYGHYLFAKLFGMEIEEFSIGFGRKPLWTWMKRGDTVFTIRPWPLGGFVRIKGMVPQDDGSEIGVENGFYSKSPLKRLLVLFAGPLFSVLAGLILLVGLFTIAGEDRPTNTAVLGEIVKGSVAEASHLQTGDRVLSIDGKPISTWGGMFNYVSQHAGQPLEFTIARGQSTLKVALTPKASEKGGVLIDDKGVPTDTKVDHPGRIGAAPTVVRTHLGLVDALSDACMAPVVMVKGIAGIFVHPKEFGDNMGGPASIAVATRDATEHGPYDVIFLAAVLSISLGILNLLPVPPMDGGQIAVALAELFRRGRRLSMEIQNAVNAIGLALIGMLIIAVLWVDAKRFVSPDVSKTQAAGRTSALAPAPEKRPQ